MLLRFHFPPYLNDPAGLAQNLPAGVLGSKPLSCKLSPASAPMTPWTAKGRRGQRRGNGEGCASRFFQGGGGSAVEVGGLTSALWDLAVVLGSISNQALNSRPKRVTEQESSHADAQKCLLLFSQSRALSDCPLVLYAIRCLEL